MAKVQRSQNYRRSENPARGRGEGSSEEGITGTLTEGYEQVRQSLAEYPTTSVVTAFAVGMGVGLVVGCALSGESRSYSYDRQHAEKLGRRVLDSIMGMVPDSVASRFSS